MSSEELKQRHGAMWNPAPYQRVTETIADIHELVIERLDPRAGRHCLDLAPALIGTAVERAAQLGLEIDYRVGDCERLELPDASFDAVSSTCGVMFAPDHATARELARVTRPGGRIALANWTPAGGVARMFAMMAPFQPAPPPANPFDWGAEQRARELLGDWFEQYLLVIGKRR